MGVTKVTIIDSPEKMRARNKGYSIIIPQVRAKPSVKKDAIGKNHPATLYYAPNNSPDCGPIKVPQALSYPQMAGLLSALHAHIQARSSD